MAALLVVAIGLLALGAVYLKLARNEDVARQRGEATRLAQEKIETMRGFTQLGAASGTVSWQALDSGTDNATTNTRYTRTWTLGGEPTDALRPLLLEVGWMDRYNEPHAVRLGTVISRTDPSDVGALGFPLPANTTLKRPKNRNLNIPVPASDLGTGESAFRLPGTNYAVIFANDSGYVVKTCDVSSSDAAITQDELSSCTTAYAYVLAGYVSIHSLSAFPDDLAVNFSGVSGHTDARCSLANATDQNTGATLPGWKYYLCVVGVGAQGAAWSGTVRLAAPALNAGSGSYRVCRFQFAPAAGVSANQRNVQPYADVADSLDSQSYLITDRASCPTVDGLATTLHQSCSAANDSRASDCPAS